MHSNSQIVRLFLSAAHSALVRKRVLNCLWELTYQCNAKCGICTYWRTPSDRGAELTLPQIREGLHKVYAYGCRFINFTGGEPTLRQDLEQIIDAASRLGIWTSLVSNGSLLTRERIRLLKSAGLDNLVLSLDSLDPAVHDTQRGIPGLHEKVLRRLRWIAEDFLTGHRTGGFMCVLGSHNLHQASDLVRFADELGVYLVFQPYHPNKTGAFDPKSVIGRETASRLQAMKEKSAALLSSRAYLAGMPTFSGGTDLPRCQAGEKYFSIDPFGYLHPCVDSPKVGHILRDPVAVVRSPQAMKAVESCPGCWYCFRGEADSTLSAPGYAEKMRLAASILLRNARRQAARSSRCRH